MQKALQHAWAGYNTYIITIYTNIYYIHIYSSHIEILSVLGTNLPIPHCFCDFILWSRDFRKQNLYMGKLSGLKTPDLMDLS